MSFITAKEANELSQKNYDNNHQNTLNEIEKEINNAIVMGKFNVKIFVNVDYIGSIEDFLIDLGYTTKIIRLNTDTYSMKVEW